MKREQFLTTTAATLVAATLPLPSLAKTTTATAAPLEYPAWYNSIPRSFLKIQYLTQGAFARHHKVKGVPGRLIKPRRTKDITYLDDFIIPTMEVVAYRNHPVDPQSKQYATNLLREQEDELFLRLLNDSLTVSLYSIPNRASYRTATKEIVIVLGTEWVGGIM